MAVAAQSAKATEVVMYQTKELVARDNSLKVFAFVHINDKGSFYMGMLTMFVLMSMGVLLFFRCSKTHKVEAKDEEVDDEDEDEAYAELASQSTVEHIKAQLKLRNQTVTGVKQDLVTRLSKTRPRASSRQCSYIKSLKSQHNALVVSLEDLSSVSRASRWIDSAKGRLKEES